jgi:hypothetical protein
LLRRKFACFSDCSYWRDIPSIGLGRGFNAGGEKRPRLFAGIYSCLFRAHFHRFVYVFEHVCS